MRCKFCYATFEDMHVAAQLPKEEAFEILRKLKAAGLQKITFAGGEPMLYRWIYEVIKYAKEIGLVTSIITNGSMITPKFLTDLKGVLDWVGVSIDSTNELTNARIGRTYRGTLDYFELVSRIKETGFKLKINTVVNKYNEQEDMSKFIEWANPLRWKIFDTLRVEGQNDRQFEEIRTTVNGFENFLARHKHPSMVPESNEAMTGSYLLIDPKGRLFENSQGRHTYSAPLQNNELTECLAQLNFSRTNFIGRGGLYNWD